MLKLLSTAALALALAGAASAAEIRFAPGDALTLNPAYPPRRVNDLFVHMTAIRTGPHERFTIRSVRFELRRAGHLVASRDYSGDEILARAQAFGRQPPPLRATEFLDPKGLAGWFGPGVKPAASTALGPNEALLAPDIYFAVDAEPDELRVIVRGEGAGGPRQSKGSIPVRAYRSPIDYRLPLKGAWLEASLPQLQSHHRFNAPTEFALDFFKVDASGATFHDASDEASDWYAYGEPVVAAADGEVVRTVTDQTMDRAFLKPLPGETPQLRGQRVGEVMEQRLARGFPNSLTGNLVVIRHTSGTVTEYSSYGHLKSGSIRVKPGDKVRQGDVIGEVGDTGDTPVAHLHFQVNAGPDPIYSQSLPVRLSDARFTGSTQDPGQFVAPK